MSIFRAVNMPMGFVVSLPFSTSFSTPENALMHPVTPLHLTGHMADAFHFTYPGQERAQYFNDFAHIKDVSEENMDLATIPADGTMDVVMEGGSNDITDPMINDPELGSPPPLKDILIELEVPPQETGRARAFEDEDDELDWGLSD